MLKLFLLATLLIVPSLSVLGVDVSQLFSTSTYQCMKTNGYYFAILRGYCSYGGVDAHITSNLQNAKAAGLVTDIYMFPCRGKSSTSQVDQMMAAISSSSYGMVWIDVETNPSSGCGWGKDYTANCNYLAELISRIKQHGKVPGVYTSSYMWQTIMGTQTSCASAATQQLWYAHYDGQASFSDYTQVGGWKRPSIKQYQGDTTLCGAGVDKNYYS